VDVGFGDATTPEPQPMVLPVLLDFPPPKLRAYARESTIAEKFHAMVELGLGNSRMKDFYDLWFLSTEFPFDGNVLAHAVRATFDRRQTGLPHVEPVGLSDVFAADAVKLTQWSAFLRRARLRKEAPPLGQLVISLRAFLMPIVNAAAKPAGFDDVESWRSMGNWMIGRGSPRRVVEFLFGTPDDARQAEVRGLVLDFLEMLAHAR
jgi:hypothetical protein